MFKYFQKYLIALILIFCANVLFAGKIEKGFEALAEHNYFKAKDIFEKLKDKKVVAASYGLSYIYVTNNNPFYNLDSARHYILRSEEAFAKADERDFEKLKEMQIDSIRIQVLKSKVSRLAFEEVKRGNELAAYNKYLADYPGALEYKEALSLRNELAFQKALNKNTSEGYSRFMELYPNAEQFREVKRRYEKSLFLEITESGEIASFVNFIREYPDNPYVLDAMDMIYKKSIHHNSIDEYERFIKNHPDNRNVHKAWRVLYALYMKDYSQERMAEFRLDYPNYPFKNELMKDFSLSFLDFYPIKKNGRWGYMDEEGKQMIKPQFDWVSEFNEGLAMVSINNLIGFIDKMGKVKIPFNYSDAEPFKNGYAVVKKDDKYGVINKANLIHIPFVYDEIGEFYDDIAYYEVEGKYGYISINNEKIVRPIYDACGDFDDGYAYVSIDGKYGIIDRKGEVVVPIEYDWLETFKSGIARVKKEDQFGLYDIYGTLITELLYDNIGAFSDGLCLASMDEKHGYLNKKGELQIPMDYDFELAALNWGEFKEGYARVRVNDKFALIDTLGKRFLPAVFEDVGQYTNTLMAVKKRGKWGFCDANARLIIPYRYDYAWGFVNDSLSKVRKDGKEGYINLEGNEEIFVVYDEISAIVNGRAKVKKEGMYGVINKLNEVVVPIEYSKLEKKNNLIEAYKDETLYYLNPENGEIVWRELSSNE